MIKPEFMFLIMWASLLGGTFLWFFIVGWVNNDAYRAERKVRSWNTLLFFCPLSLIIYLCLFRKKKARKVETTDAENLELLKGDRSPLSSSRFDGEKRLVLSSVENLIKRALDNRSTDIHLEPKDDLLHTRFRIDGFLREGPSFSLDLGLNILSCLKVLAQMDIAQKRKAQDGSFIAKMAGNTISFRVSTTTSIYGETMVIRVLNPKSGLISLEDLGFLPYIETEVTSLISRSQGMILVTGPSGSGKTTTLYAILNQLNTGERNIISIEDPVEYELANVTQIPVDPKAGVDFANSIRSILRHDPDVIMVGEVRDMATAEVAVRASLTGHLVLSTLHTREAAGAIARLLDMKLEPHLVSSSLVGVLAQRLIQVLCRNCKAPCTPKDLEYFHEKGLKLGEGDGLYKPVGCAHCGGTGYRGRTGIFELLIVDEDINTLIEKKASAEEILSQAKEKGMVTMRQYGWEKVKQGISTLDEVERVLL